MTPMGAIKPMSALARTITVLLHLANNTARTQIPVHNHLCQECGGYRQGYGRIEAHSFLLKRRESTLSVRSEVLEVLEVKDDKWFGRLDDDSPKVKWIRRVYPELITRRHRGRSQAPWTVVMLRQPGLKHPNLKGGIDVSPAVPHSVCLFVGSSPSWRHSRSGIIICNKSYNYRQHWCTQQTACSTHTHPYCN